MEVKIVVNNAIRQLVSCAIALSLLALSFVGCASAQNRPNASKPPDIPPESSFLMDFSDFTSSSTNSSSLVPVVRLVSFAVLNADPYVNTDNALGDCSNWGFAVLNVGFWDIVGFLGLAVPVASFIESFEHVPVQQADHSWVWSYNVTAQGVVYTAELHGKYIDSRVRWEMFISKQGEYANFLWYYGESDLPATGGYWILKNKPAVPSELLRIDWHRNVASKTSDITYTNIVPGGGENGGYISYAITVAMPFDRSYKIYNKGRNETTNIEWNSVTREGRVKDTILFRDENWHCWNSQLVNTECK